MEINQPWDWNEYWTNTKYPDDEEYKTSCQPALVYRAIVNLDNAEKTYPMKVIGHSHYSGKTGELFNVEAMIVSNTATVFATDIDSSFTGGSDFSIYSPAVPFLLYFIKLDLDSWDLNLLQGAGDSILICAY
jgi:hypothetical protein